MIIMVYGGSGSGKSAYAEWLLTTLAEQNTKYYIATMQVLGEEGQQKVKRHHDLRAGKGFITIEKKRDIEGIAKKLSSERNSILLECMSNLVANEMFTEKGIVKGSELVRKIMQGIEVLSKQAEHLIVVANNIFEDGIKYDETTMEYIKALGRINRELTSLADSLIEIVVGIPIIIKSCKEVEKCGL